MGKQLSIKYRCLSPCCNKYGERTEYPHIPDIFLLNYSPTSEKELKSHQPNYFILFYLFFMLIQ